MALFNLVLEYRLIFFQWFSMGKIDGKLHHGLTNFMALKFGINGHFPQFIFFLPYFDKGETAH